MIETKPETRKKGREHYSSAILHAKRDRKRAEAEARQLEHDSLTVEQKLQKAYSRGGSQREVARLQKLLKTVKPVVSPPVSPEVSPKTKVKTVKTKKVKTKQ